MPCPFCQFIGTLILNGYLKSKPETIDQPFIIRGHRIFCSNRNRKSGCGRTYSLKLSVFVGRLRQKASGIWEFLSNLLKGQSTFLAFRNTGLSYSNSSIYRLYNRLIRNQSSIRSLLHLILKPEFLQKTPSPLILTILHLRNAFIESQCPIASFQCHFQTSFL